MNTTPPDHHRLRFVLFPFLGSPVSIAIATLYAPWRFARTFVGDAL
jgi:hypothetical protein